MSVPFNAEVHEKSLEIYNAMDSFSRDQITIAAAKISYMAFRFNEANAQMEEYAQTDVLYKQECDKLKTGESCYMGDEDEVKITKSDPLDFYRIDDKAFIRDHKDDELGKKCICHYSLADKYIFSEINYEETGTRNLYKPIVYDNYIDALEAAVFYDEALGQSYEEQAAKCAEKKIVEVMKENGLEMFEFNDMVIKHRPAQENSYVDHQTLLNENPSEFYKYSEYVNYQCCTDKVNEEYMAESYVPKESINTYRQMFEKETACQR